jgi:hypothetical protein
MPTGQLLLPDLLPAVCTVAMASRMCGGPSGLFGLNRRASEPELASVDTGATAPPLSDAAAGAVLVAWSDCVHDTRTLLRDVQAGIDGARVRDDSLAKVLTAALRTLADSRASMVSGLSKDRVEDFQAEVSVLNHLEARVKSRLEEMDATASELQARVQRLVAALDCAVSSADTALSERRKAQSDATAAVVKDMQRLVGDSRDWEFRARNAETELERLRGELERARGAAGDGGVSDVRESGQGTTGEGDLQMSPTAAARSQQPPRRSRLTREPTAAGVGAAESTEEEDAMRAAAENNAALPAEQWAVFTASWDAFCSNPPSSISQADIPWPDMDVLEQLYMCGDAKAVDAKKLRADWHPDKFTQKFGSRLAPEERESILRAVTDLAGRINAMGLV